MGLNDPPKPPTRSNAALLPHLAVAKHDELRRRQLLRTHRAARVELGRGDAHLRAHAELAAVPHAGGGSWAVERPLPAPMPTGLPPPGGVGALTTPPAAPPSWANRRARR